MALYIKNYGFMYVRRIHAEVGRDSRSVLQRIKYTLSGKLIDLEAQKNPHVAGFLEYLTMK